MSRRLSKVTFAGTMALMLASFSATAQGFSSPNASLLERQIQLRGTVVCTGCRLQEARQNPSYKTSNRLYQVTLSGGKSVVMDLEAVSNTRWLNNVVIPNLWVRGTDAQLQKLSAQESATKVVEVSGFVTDSNMLNVTVVTVLPGADSNAVAQR